MVVAVPCCSSHRKQQDKFYLIAVVGEEWLVAVILQAMLQSRASDMHFRTALIPTSESCSVSAPLLNSSPYHLQHPHHLHSSPPPLPNAPFSLLSAAPTGVGVVSGRMGVLDEELHALFPLDTDWTQMNSGELLNSLSSSHFPSPTSTPSSPLDIICDRPRENLT